MSVSGTQPGETDGAPRGSSVLGLVRLMRPHQWTKSVFVLIGPFYASLAPGGTDLGVLAAFGPALLAAAAFAIASSGCYIVNDYMDREADRMHPRKKHRPLAAGTVSPRAALALAAACWVAGAGIAASLAVFDGWAALWVGIVVALYVANVLLYSLDIKHRPIADVMSLSIGFVLRVIAGCLAIGVAPSTWLLNAVLFLSMFLAFGKRLGERRALQRLASGSDERRLDAKELSILAAKVRRVQQRYSDQLLEMAVVTTAVATLLTYAGYLQSQEEFYTIGALRFNLLWATILPATYAMLRALLLLDRGMYDDPTELATRDRPSQVAGVAFVGITLGAIGAARHFGA
ncbi:MAG: UbiA family prenyltransferase [Phycisphaerales bacterium]